MEGQQLKCFRRNTFPAGGQHGGEAANGVASQEEGLPRFQKQLIPTE